MSMSSDKSQGVRQERRAAERLPGLDGNMDFATREAFNLLRTNLMFSFADDDNARIIGVTSSTPGEGKSYVACNLALSFAETGKRVLLLEGDLRLPTVAKKLSVRKSPGVSNVLTNSINDISDVLQRNVLGSLDVITAGDIPPNPTTLLGSRRMQKFIGLLAKSYDYIVLDLPPVAAVSDALIVKDLVSGFVLVVRHDRSDKSDVKEALRQMKLTNARILGFVYNGSTSNSGSYSKKSHYYGKYDKSYRKSYETAAGNNPSRRLEAQENRQKPK